MGLDMYLTAKKYFWSHSKEKDEKLMKLLQKEFQVSLQPKAVEFEVMYWRKANQIHKWFVDNVQDGNDDCGTYYVSREQLQALLNAVEDALGSKNPEKVLPPTEGFFFGNTSVDEYYRQDLEDTKQTLKKFLASKVDDMDCYYHSSW